MTEKDKKELAKMIAEEMKDHQPAIQCPNGITQEYAQAIKEFVNLMNTGKKAATRTLVVIFITTVVGLIIAGFWSKVAALFGKS